MTEQQVQTKLIKRLEKDGYYVLKLVKTNKNGIPDVLAIPPDCPVEFFEVKRPGKKPSPLQEFRMSELRKHGCKAVSYDGEA